MTYAFPPDLRQLVGEQMASGKYVSEVVVHRLANQDLEEAYEWAARSAPATAARWLGRFQAALHGLELNPERHPRAKESRKLQIELYGLILLWSANVIRSHIH